MTRAQLHARRYAKNVHRGQFLRKRTTDPIPHLKLGKYCRFGWGSPELAAWLEARMVGAHNSKVVRSSGKERIQ